MEAGRWVRRRACVHVVPPSQPKTLQVRVMASGTDQSFGGVSRLCARLLRLTGREPLPCGPEDLGGLVQSQTRRTELVGRATN